MNEKLLVVGSGGREHALGWALEPHVDQVTYAPGNGGTGPNMDVPITDFSALARFARREDAFTIVGPDLAVARGIVNYFERRKLPILGPVREAALLESSKTFAAEFNKVNGIPQPNFVSFDDYDKAVQYALTHDPLGYVIKADGLAGGKGVVLPETPEAAAACLRGFMKDRVFGVSGDKVLFQQRLYDAEELSVFALCDGENAILLPSFRDFKQKYNGDKGPNTGGMGSFGPVEIDEKTRKIIEKQVVRPVLKGMQDRDTPYRGILYAGMMLTPGGPKVIEYNARYGDPECQAMMLLAQRDLYAAMQQATDGKLQQKTLNFNPGVAMTVALTAHGYAELGGPRKGDEIYGLDEVPEDIIVFHGGTARRNNRLVTNGGRVVYVSTLAGTTAQTHGRIYDFLSEKVLHFAGIHYRDDIGL